MNHLVNCHSNRMEVQLEFEEPFSGVIFADQAYNDSSCRWEGQLSSKLNFTIPVSTKDGLSACEATLEQVFLNEYN
ncbi:unnamed protein product [Gongylonema pulchrum]|uniref:ZP domain-containing protein n=1 Tax=Gongylonema pulchrum TaxID=637853 RepID=A0A183EZ15_9BILA|nr:unnamed protein product [Gongylonema pulchrum]